MFSFVLVYCVKKNLATLAKTIFGWLVKIRVRRPFILRATIDAATSSYIRRNQAVAMIAVLCVVWLVLAHASGSNGEDGECGSRQLHNNDYVTWVNSLPILIEQDLKGGLDGPT
jgi:hypothetical protein